MTRDEAQVAIDAALDQGFDALNAAWLDPPVDVDALYAAVLALNELLPAHLRLAVPPF